MFSRNLKAVSYKALYSLATSVSFMLKTEEQQIVKIIIFSRGIVRVKCLKLYKSLYKMRNIGFVEQKIIFQENSLLNNKQIIVA